MLRTKLVVLLLAGCCLSHAANRFWVGGTATWDGTTTANWSATSGGASGASVPTSADDAFFDAASGAVTVTLSAAATCNNLTFTGFTGTLSHPAIMAPSIFGSLTLAATMTYTTTNINSFLLFSATTTGKTITTAGKTVRGFYFNGIGGGWTLADAVTATGNILFENGVFNTGNFNVTCLQFNLRFAHTIGHTTVNLGSSTLTITLFGTGPDQVAGGNAVVNAGTSQIILTGGGAALDVGGYTVYDVTFQDGNSNSRIILGDMSGTVHNLTISGNTTSTAGFILQGIAAGVTLNVTGTLTITGTSITSRLLLQGSSNVDAICCTGGATPIINTNSPVISNADFMDINTSGSGWDLSAATGGSGDCGNNTGITFTPATTQTWTNANGGTWSTAANWTSRVPLCQDSANLGIAFNASKTVTMDLVQGTGSVDWTGATNSPTWNITAGFPMFYGDMTLISGMTVTTAVTIQFMKFGTMNLTTAGKSLGNIRQNRANTVVFADAFTTTGTYTQMFGTLNANNKAVSMGKYSSANTNTRALLMGTQAWSLTSTGTVWDTSTPDNMTLTPSSSVMTLMDTSSTAKTFAGGGLTFGAVTIPAAGTGTITISGSNTFTTFTSGAPKTLIFTAGTTQTFTTLALNSSAGNIITIQSSSAGSAASLSIASGTLNYDYLSIKDSAAIGGATWYAGAHSTNVSGNSGWIFSRNPVISGKFSMSGKLLITGK